MLELPLKYGEEIYGFGLQPKGFDHKNTKKTLRVNSDPVSNTGDSHAPVPFFVTTQNYGIYFDTARYAEFHFGYSHVKDRKAVANNTVIATPADLYNKSGLKEDTILPVEIPVSQGMDIYIM